MSSSRGILVPFALPHVAAFFDTSLGCRAARCLHTSSVCAKKGKDEVLLTHLRASAAQLSHQQGWPWERPSDIEARRTFVDALKAELWDAPDNVQSIMTSKGIQVGYVYASGPGGQHVNKTRSKAQVLLALSTGPLHDEGRRVLRDSADSNALPSEVVARQAKTPRWIPAGVVKALVIRSGAHYSSASHSIAFEAQDSRSQHANLRLALKRMHAHLIEVAGTGLPSPPRDEQLKKVHRLAQAHKNKTKEQKIKRGVNKAAKRGARAAL